MSVNALINVPIHALTAEQQEKCRSAMNEEQTKSLSATNHWAHVDRNQVHADWDALYKEFSGLIDTSNAIDSDVQEFVAQHYQIASRFYVPSRDAYIGMALFYSENDDMKNFHNAYHPKMVDFLGDAMCIYAQNKL